MQEILLSSLVLLLPHPSYLPRIVRASKLLLGGLAPWAALRGLQLIHCTVLKPNYYVA